MTTPESYVVKACIEWLYLHKIKFWRNNSGSYKTESGAWVRYGDKGSPDILCRVPITINGRKTASLLGVECKSDKGKLSPEQIAWRDAHVADGGVYIVARSVEDLIAHRSELLP